MNYNTDSAGDVIAVGLTAGELVELLDSNDAEFAAKALNYFDGKQEQEMEKLLSHPEKGRKQWKARGYIPRFRNLTKMIVEKSGMLFKDAPPQFEVRIPGQDAVITDATEALVDMLDGTEWQETMINLDAVVRMLKTAVLLVQWDEINQKPVFDILHRANCNVVINPLTKQIDCLVQRTGCSGKSEYYRVWTPDLVIDLIETSERVSIAAQTPNTYGVVPAEVFYDTNMPRAGFWVEPARDLVNMNEMYNVHMTDSEFAISWVKRPSLFTNCSLDGYSDEVLEVVEVVGSALPRAVSRTPSLTAGPDVAIQLGSTGGGDTPFVEYKAPVIDLKPLDDVVQGWIKQTAADWSVRVRADGEGSATSGFQVVVEEAPNLELRQLRQRMFEAGFKRLYRKLKVVLPIDLPEDGELFVVFAKPNLPVDPKAQEDVWSVRLKEGRATEIEYLMETQGLTEKEAEAKWAEIIKFRLLKAELTASLNPINPAQPGPQQNDNQQPPQQ